MDLLTGFFSQEQYVRWMEVLVIISILAFVIYIAYCLNLFKKE